MDSHHVPKRTKINHSGNASVDWNCTACTLVNKGFHLACSVCGTEKPMNPGGDDDDEVEIVDVIEAPSVMANEWQCEWCSGVNDRLVYKCHLCDTARKGGVKHPSRAATDPRDETLSVPNPCKPSSTHEAPEPPCRADHQDKGVNLLHALERELVTAGTRGYARQV